MHLPSSLGRQFVHAGLGALALVAWGAGTAVAQSAAVQRAPIGVTMKLPKQVAKVTFNWHGNARVWQISDTERASVLLVANRIGRRGATWVCSPAGYGRNSTCTR